MKGCRAVLENDRLVLENDFLRRGYAWNHGHLISQALSDRITGRVWTLAGNEPDVDLPGVPAQSARGGPQSTTLPEGVPLVQSEGELSVSDHFNVRVGKIYRKFGLYNEILDAVPTYIGIEPPELFDSDHLLISRTTICMIHGLFRLGEGTLNYSLSTDNGEGDIFKDSFPAGFDTHYKFGKDKYTLGISGYTSGGKTNSDAGVGGGPPRSGVLPWMDHDEFYVLGGYTEARVDNLTLQFAYWHARHDCSRDPASVVSVVNGTDINPRQRARFLKNPYGTVDEDNVNVSGDYDVDTAYIRAGYSFVTSFGELVPYVQWDWYASEETIGSKSWGGDNEAGVADDGEFHKGTIGVVYRPIPAVAIKLDGSSHFYKFNGDNEMYPEVRLDFSYIFGM